MEPLVMQAGDWVDGDDDPARRGQDGGVPPLPDEPDDSLERISPPGVVDAWFFLGW